MTSGTHIVAGGEHSGKEGSREGQDEHDGLHQATTELGLNSSAQVKQVTLSAWQGIYCSSGGQATAARSLSACCKEHCQALLPCGRHLPAITGMPKAHVQSWTISSEGELQHVHIIRRPQADPARGCLSRAVHSQEMCSSAAVQRTHFGRQPQADSTRGCMSRGPTSTAARLVFLSAGRAASSLGSEPAILSGVPMDGALLLKLGMLRENTGFLVMWRWMSSQFCCLQAHQTCAAGNQKLVQHLSCALAAAVRCRLQRHCGAATATRHPRALRMQKHQSLTGTVARQQLYSGGQFLCQWAGAPSKHLAGTAFKAGCMVSLIAPFKERQLAAWQ